MVGLWLQLDGGHTTLDAPGRLIRRWQPSHTLRHWVCFTRRLFNNNNFAGSAALVEVYALLSAILVHYCFADASQK